MTDTATILREYHSWLDRANTPREWRDRVLGFLVRHFPDEKTPPAFRTVSLAHRARVHGEGSPAECDAALNQALREIGS